MTGYSSEIPIWADLLIGAVIALLLIIFIVCIVKKMRAASTTNNLNSMERIFYKTNPYFELTKENVQPNLESNNCGKIKVSLHYNPTAGKLKVGVLECSALPISNPNASNVYVKVHMEPKRKPSFETETKSNTADPEFNETFSFSVADETELATKTVVFSVYDYDRFSKSEKLAVLFLPLNSVVTSTLLEDWYDLSRPSDSGERNTDVGQIRISLRFVPAAGQIKITIVEARDIPKELLHNGEVYARFSLYHRKKRLAKKKTSAKKDLQNPFFNETFAVNLMPSQSQEAVLSVTLSEKNAIGISNDIGSVELGARARGLCAAHWTNAMIYQGHSIAQWHALYA